MNLESIVQRLQQNSVAIEALTAGVAPGQAMWRPQPNKWSLLEVICHLCDEEVDDFRTRVDLTLHRPGEAWPSIDPQGWVQSRNYAAANFENQRREFARRRADSLGWLDSLKQPDWDLAYEHPKLGRLRAGDLLLSWLVHDQLHIRQISQLHVDYHTAHQSPYSGAYALP
jgi:hypothetical protein